MLRAITPIRFKTALVLVLAASLPLSLSAIPQSRQPWVVGRTKVPNPYTLARSHAECVRPEPEKTSKRSVDHQRTAESLRARQPQ